ncbi:unnamed protein product, partial [Mesorhabditis belari]|uniref:Probable U2 small nuclear ribonucleoprotein A' n=1 Tax=Mesorhabditis belari TaxID=2138241 RepID=A0AAF3J5N6_9BILA
MVRMSIELLTDASQYVNTVKDRELNLRSYKIPVIENMGVTRDQFDTLDLTDNDIKKLENFPLLKRLNTLYAHNNRIHFIQPDLGAKLPNLKRMMLTNNNITELGDIDALAKCKFLEHLSFHGNPITHKEHYRLYVIYRIPTVRVLDFQRIKLQERENAKKLFKGKKNKKLLEEVGRKSTFNPEADKENQAVDEEMENGDEGAGRPGQQLNDEDKAKIREAIRNAKSLQEAEFLQSVLDSGRIPEKGWNMGLELSRMQFSQQQNGADGAEKGFQPETEEQEGEAMES